MPTFDDPIKDAAEASAALRGLAHATRQFESPADTYPVIGDLLAGVRSLRQVLDQLAAAHIRSRGIAHDDAGNQAAGATSALAAADELHQAGTLLDTVEWRLDAASQHSGRIAWHPAMPATDLPGPDLVETSVSAGTLTLTVWPDEPLGEHQRYAYRIEDTASEQSIEGRDLFTGRGDPVPPEHALRQLALFLRGSGETRQQVLDRGLDYQGPFHEWAAEAAHQNADALRELTEPATGPVGPTSTRWISVVFLDGEEGDKVLALIQASGTDAAIDHLAGYDYGEDTVRDALANGYVYDAPPRGRLDRVATKDAYALSYSPFLGHVSLLREYDADPDPALTGPDIHAPAVRASERAAARATRTEPVDWFARAPRAASSSGRGLSL